MPSFLEASNADRNPRADIIPAGELRRPGSSSGCVGVSNCVHVLPCMSNLVSLVISNKLTKLS